MYGSAPYTVVFIHGGPGDIGSLKNCANQFSSLSEMGAAEPLQSKYSIGALLKELYWQIKESCFTKVTLAGHSWGAWLAALFAEKHPELCEKIILFGCPPLTDSYVKEISQRRLQNLSGEDRSIYARLADNRATDEDMRKIPGILEKSDHYCLLDSRQTADKIDGRMFTHVWNEAAELRSSGILLSAFQNIKCNIYLIQGAMDPHPINGVIEPLEKLGIDYEAYRLEKCGHSPFAEKYAREDFYKILLKIIW